MELMFCKIVLPLVIGSALAGCAMAPPTHPENLCEIFGEKPGWHAGALKAQNRWSVPLQVPMAMMYQESSFRHNARPPRKYLLGFIPWGRVSSAYGYAQALDGTWSDYKRQAGGVFARRDNFNDAIDFMGWYMDQSQKQNGIAKTDVYNQYLAYHEGQTGWRRKAYNQKAWLKSTAVTVGARAQRFAAQYAQCRDRLPRGGWFR